MAFMTVSGANALSLRKKQEYSGALPVFMSWGARQKGQWGVEYAESGGKLQRQAIHRNQRFPTLNLSALLPETSCSGQAGLDLGMNWLELVRETI